MFFHLDNFEVYDTVRTTGNMDLTWLSKQYQVLPVATPTNLRIQEWSGGRIGLGTVAATNGVRSIYLPVSSYLSEDVTTINVTQRLLDYAPNGVASFGLSIVGLSVDNHILSFGFNDLKNGFVTYVDAGGTVRVDPFTLAVSLTGSQDVIEWSFEKSSEDRNEYKPFILWVNNKPAYVGSVFCQVGAAAGLAVRVGGGVNSALDGTTSSTGFVNRAGNVTIPKMGITDLVLNDGKRNGLVRVVSRAPEVDIGPNSMIPNVSTESNAALVGVIPPNATNHLTAVSASAAEMYGASAFPDLSSEAVLAYAVQVVGSKNNPFSLNLAGQIRSNGQTKEIGDLAVDLTPSFSQVILDRNPATNLPWTALEANNSNFGVKVV